MRGPGEDDGRRFRTVGGRVRRGRGRVCPENRLDGGSDYGVPSTGPDLGGSDRKQKGWTAPLWGSDLEGEG